MKLQNISKSYGTHQVLKDISMNINDGIHGFLGANGVGKTTLFKIISGYTRSFKGRIEYPAIKEKGQVLMSYLPQEFIGYPELTVMEFLRYMGKLKADINTDVIDKEIQEKLEIFSLSDKKKKKLKELSGGQLRRVGLVQAFILNPRIILLDEPTTGLDPTERIKFKNYISSLGKDQLILLSTHIVTDLEFITKKIYILKDGNFVAQGKEEELLNIAQGYVWEAVPKTSKEQELWMQKYVISKIYETNHSIKMRIISKEKPLQEAIEIKPTLDDIYLMIFKDREKAHVL